MRSLLNTNGYCGCILPTGIATTDTTKEYFSDLLVSRELVSLYDFDNREGIFPGVQGNVRFCLLTFARPHREHFQAGALLSSTAQLSDRDAVYSLAIDDIRLINPNTLSCPMFAHATDVRIVKSIYRVSVILEKENAATLNPWNVEMRRMFHMGDDSNFFFTKQELCAEGLELTGNLFRKGDLNFLPLYEAKMAHQFTHRATTFSGIVEADQFGTHPATRDLTTAELQDPHLSPLPRYWVSAEKVQPYLNNSTYLLGFRNAVSAVADARSLVASILPPYGAGDSLKFIFCADRIPETCLLLSLFNGFIMDYVFRQKASGGNASFFIIKQLPFLHPGALKRCHAFLGPTTLAQWIVPRVLELTYSAWDLASFAWRCGYQGPPFLWDAERRFLIRCELDAAFFHLYGINREDGDYIMDTFPIVKRKDEAKFGEYRTKRVILEIYDAMSTAICTGHPYSMRLDPPPGPPEGGLPDWIPGALRPSNWPPHIHPPRGCHD